MNNYNIPIIEPTIDYSKVPAINQKRTISFFNHFIVHTVTFLNKFSLFCEEKLFEFENKLQKVEASLELLESKLNSVPGLELDVEAVINDKTSNVKESLEEEAKPVESENPKIEENEEKVLNESNLETASNKQETLKSDPKYEKYFKMVHFGVPKQAVKLKMEQEGLDSSLLE